MKTAWLPAACTRLGIFISYSSENHELADEIAQALKNEGHDVFFDKDSLPPGEEYNERIREALARADRCVFLITRTSIEQGKYMLTEIDLARARWPVPVGHVLPVIVDPGLAPADLPVYLKSVSAISPKGSIAAGIAATIDRSRRINWTCRACLAVCATAIVFAAALGVAVLLRPANPMVGIALLPIEKVHFRPRAASPRNLLAADAPVGWIDSPLTVTAMSIAYSRRDQGGANASLLREELDIQLGAVLHRYAWSYVVEIKREEGCPDDWLCRVANVGVVNLAAGRSSDARETMFLPRSDQPLSWRDFIDGILSPQGPADMAVKVRSYLEVSNAGGTAQMALESVCALDVKSARAEFLKYFKPGQDPRPAFWQPSCLQ